jgi:hypothetical protein
MNTKDGHKYRRYNMKIPYIGKSDNQYLLEYKQHDKYKDYFKCLMLTKALLREYNSSCGRIMPEYEYIKSCMIKEMPEIQDYIKTGSGRIYITKEITVHDTCGNY